MTTRPLTLASLLLSALVTTTLQADAEQEATEHFEKKIRPVLVEHCYKCHSADADEVEGKLLLDTREGIRRGGESGPAVMPGNVSKSLLVAALRHESFEMPPDSKLPAEVIADFERWIESGAVDPRDGSSPTPKKDQIDFSKGRQFWSFQSPQRHPRPNVENRDWPRQPIDWFVLKKLEEARLSPNDAADARTLVRRLSLDVTGLPPSAEQVTALNFDPSPRAYETFVDHLLESPHYGERLARMWLDVARYAEDQAHIVGANSSLFYPNAYLYRDWVIQALNDDMPFDQFIKLQLAADLIDPEALSTHAALGFIGLGPKYYRRNSPAVMADEWEDRVDTVARGLLGLTIACARCHDHKFDPIATEDYYALAGIFAGTEMYNRPLDAANHQAKPAKKPGEAMHVVRDSKPRDLNVLIRGDVTNKGAVVKRRFPRVLSSDPPAAFVHGSGRRELAEAIVNADNPLTARVLVNRVWALYLGRPLVATPSNFGELGERPSHALLLDDLARRFMDHGWSLKWLTREIVLSATYRQGSVTTAEKLAADADNRLLSRMARKRLNIEGWRDSVLAVSGRLDRNVGGPSIDPRDPEQTRRTVYSHISRLDLNPLLAMFDFPDPNVHAARRAETTTPLQKLFIMNSPFMTKQADYLAERLQRVDPESPQQNIDQQIAAAYQRVFGRSATDDEVNLGRQFLQDGSDRKEAWRQYAQVLLASNELLFVD